MKKEGEKDQRNNFTVINEDTRKTPTSALKHVTNSQIKKTQLVQQRQEDKTLKYRADNVKYLSLFPYIFFLDPIRKFEVKPNIFLEF